MTYLNDRWKQKIFGKEPEKKEPYVIPKKSEKKKKQEREEKKERGGEQTDQQKWYTVIMNSENPVCWETGQKISPDEFHGSIAHILPKALFPSVATHPQNYMILKMWGGTHANYDSSWETAAKMKVWTYAIKIITTVLFPLLTREERAKLPDLIIQEIPPEMYNK